MENTEIDVRQTKEKEFDPKSVIFSWNLRLSDTAAVEKLLREKHTKRGGKPVIRKIPPLSEEEKKAIEKFWECGEKGEPFELEWKKYNSEVNTKVTKKKKLNY